MLDHLVLNVSDMGAARTFYDAVLPVLGYSVVMEYEEGVGYGIDGKPIFWIGRRDPISHGAHVALACTDHATVDAFHAAAMAVGATDHGAPGLRPHYHEHYYGAFVLDPDGNNIEAVCHLPQGG